MSLKKFLCLILSGVLIICIVLFIGLFTRSNDRRYNLSREYKTAYYEFVSSVESSEANDMLVKISDDDTKKKIESLKNVLDNIETYDGNKKEYIEFKTWYDEIIAIRVSYSEWSELSTDEKAKINSYLSSASFRKDIIGKELGIGE